MTATATLTPATVPRLFPEATLVILASGPSLALVDIAHCRRRGVPVLALKNAIAIAPWADVLYACDRRWWRAHPETRTYGGPKYGLEALPDRPDVQILRNTGEIGLEMDPTSIPDLIERFGVVFPCEPLGV